MTTLTLKSTALVDEHKKLGAKLVDFAGYNMPVWYNNAKEEHLAVRNRVGMFDISHMGMVIFNGADAHSFLQRVCTNDIDKLQQNKIIYTMILNEDGGILDDVMVGFNDDLGAYFMIINASNKDKIMNWFEKNGLDRSTVDIRFDTHGLIAIQGPSAMSSIESLFNINWDQLGRFQSQLFEFNGYQCFIMRTGYTGEDGVEISAPNDCLVDIWKLCIDQGITPCGLAARDSLRIESGLPLYGHELSENITPLQTRYKWVLAWGTNFIGESALSSRKETVTDVTVGLQFTDRCLPRQGNVISDGGMITSGSFSPVLDSPIAIAMVPKDVAQDDIILVDIRGKERSATLVKLPFLN